MDSQYPTLHVEGEVSVYAISDVHSSIPQNMEWVKELVKRRKKGKEGGTSILLVAGDVAESLECIGETLSLFKKAFTEVFFTHGNHDLWLTKDQQTKSNSLTKLQSLFSLCSSLGVHTTPLLISPKEEKGRKFWIVPILSWHHSSFDTEIDIPKEEAKIPEHHLIFQDFKRCTWPSSLSPLTDQVASHIDSLNPSSLFSSIASSPFPTLSFSHFLPHLPLLPEKRFLFFPNLAKGVGSNFLRERVRELKSVVHVFGHTHFGWDMGIEGTRFIQMPLGYPTERDTRGKSLYVGENHTINWDEKSGGWGKVKIFPEPIKIYDSRGKWGGGGGGERGGEGEGGCFVPKMWAFWSHEYEERERDPENTTLAPWVKGRW